MAKKKTVAKKDVKTELTDLEKFYIEQKCREGVELREIKKQNISPISLVEQLYHETVAKTQDENRMTAGKLLSRKEDYGAVVMTPQSSEFSDESKKNKQSKVSVKSATRPEHIHKFR
jgi:hypothetical protein